MPSSKGLIHRVSQHRSQLPYQLPEAPKPKAAPKGTTKAEPKTKGKEAEITKKPQASDGKNGPKKQGKR